jgi:hypothetical protein
VVLKASPVRSRAGAQLVRLAGALLGLVKLMRNKAVPTAFIQNFEADSRIRLYLISKHQTTSTPNMRKPYSCSGLAMHLMFLRLLGSCPANHIQLCKPVGQLEKTAIWKDMKATTQMQLASAMRGALRSFLALSKLLHCQPKFTNPHPPSRLHNQLQSVDCDQLSCHRPLS